MVFQRCDDVASRDQSAAMPVVLVCPLRFVLRPGVVVAQCEGVELLADFSLLGLEIEACLGEIPLAAITGVPVPWAARPGL